MADENRGSMAQSMKRNFAKASRFRIWAMLTLMSMIVIITICDAIKRSSFDSDVRWGLAVAGISMGLAFIFSVISYFKMWDGVMNDGFPEFLAAAICCALWIIGASIVLNPDSEIASTIEPNTGIEVIRIPNIYFSTWISLIGSVYLIACFFVDDVKSQDRTVVNWLFMFTLSAIILVTSCTVQEGICDIAEDTRCNRTTYTIAFSAAMLAVSIIVLFLYGFATFHPLMECCFSVISAVLYIVGVILITSSNGPGRTIGALYICAWGGAALSCLILFQSIQAMRQKKVPDREILEQDDDEED